MMEDGNCLYQVHKLQPSDCLINKTNCYTGVVTDTTTTNKDQQGGSQFSLRLIIARIKRLDFIVVYSSLLILAILLLVIVFFGSGRPFNQSLIQPNINPWIPRVLWIVGTILSYVGFYFLWQNVEIHEIPRDLIVSVLFIVTGFLFVAWGVAYYYAEDITLSLWIAVVIFIYNLWIMIYVWYIKPIAAIFLIPNMILYGYLVYITAHTASLNNIPI